MEKVPYVLSNYIREHYREGYLSEVEPYKTREGHTVYKVEVVEDDIIHYLKFTEDGKLIGHRSEPLFKEDYYEGEFYGKED